MKIIEIIFNSSNDLQITISKWLLILAIPFVIYLIIQLFKNIIRKSTPLEINQVELGIGKQKVIIKPNFEDKQIAYKLWVELSTRKIGLPIEFEHDVISEIYDSWYEFFKLTRELIKNIPINKVQSHESTLNLVNTAIDVLNNGLRPHLTRWQAKFRKWISAQDSIPEKQNISPQDLQKQFPDYDDLATDMLIVNNRLIYYRELLRKIALGK